MSESTPSEPTPLEPAIDELLGILRRASTADVCCYVSVIWMKQGPDAVKDFGLSSPQRQTFYLLGLMMTTPEPETVEPLSEDDWKRIFELLEAITTNYVYEPMQKIVAGEIDADKANVAAAAFIQYFMSGRLAVAEQLERLIRAFHVTFDEPIRAKAGISATETLEIVNWMKEALIERWGDGLKTAQAAHEAHQQSIDLLTAGPGSFPENLAAWQASPEFDATQDAVQAYFDFSRYLNCIPRATFVERFGEERTEAFLRTFAMRRGETHGFRYFASSEPPNPAEYAPLFMLEDDRVCAPMHAMLYNALFDSFDELLRLDDTLRNRYLERRADYLEERANSLIASLFPNASISLNTYFETPKQQFEHDGLILSGGALLPIEEKSSEMTTPSRNPERYFERLKQHFKSDRGIQHGYDQANRVIDLVTSATKPVPFYDQRGNVIAEIMPGSVTEMFPIVVTLESFGMLATDLTLMLNVPAGKAYPWVVNLFDLETLVDGFLRKGLTGDDFLRYLRQRREIQGHVLTDDELNLAGQFIVERNLPMGKPGTTTFVASYASVFDDLYFEQHGVENDSMAGAIPGGVIMDMNASLKAGKPVFLEKTVSRSPKIGRNEPCPCGSGKKHKRCCGRSI
jgi:SEC-C motif